MTVDVGDKISNCRRCIDRATSPEKAPVISIQTYQPMQLVCMDFLRWVNQNGVLTHRPTSYITDHITMLMRFPQRLQPMPYLTLFFITMITDLQRLQSDQVANFESGVIQELCELTLVLLEPYISGFDQVSEETKHAKCH